MIITMHGLSTMHSNMRTDIRIAREAGFEALEVVESKLLRYLDQGYGAAELVPTFDAHGIRPICINALKGMEVQEPEARARIMATGERLCEAAAAFGCPTIQLVSLCSLVGQPWPEVRRLTARNVAELADMGKPLGLRFQLEPVAWAPVHSLRQSLEIIDEAGRDNVGMVIDFWHLSAGEETTPDEVSRLPGSLIYGVHFCDGVLHVAGTEWVEGELRGYLPGDGHLPISEWVAAVRSTGFDGMWSCELYSPRHWEWDVLEVARETRSRMEKYLSR